MKIQTVSVKALSSHTSLSYSDGTSEDCHCKEEVEKEEAKALVQAIERSGLEQSQLPFVPGLSSTDSKTITIHVEPEVRDKSGIIFYGYGNAIERSGLDHPHNS